MIKTSYEIKSSIPSWDNVEDNSFSLGSKDYAWLPPGLTPLLHIKKWVHGTHEALKKRLPVKFMLMMSVAGNTLFALLHILRFTVQRVIPILTSGIILGYEFYSHISIIICLYNIKKELQNNASDNIKLFLNPNRRVITLPGVLKLLIPRTNKCFHKSFFQHLALKLSELKLNNNIKAQDDIKTFISKEIHKTTHVLGMGFLTLLLSSIITFTPISSIGLIAFISIFCVSSITYILRYYYASDYLKLEDIREIELPTQT